MSAHSSLIKAVPVILLAGCSAVTGAISNALDPIQGVNAKAPGIREQRHAIAVGVAFDPGLPNAYPKEFGAAWRECLAKTLREGVTSPLGVAAITVKYGKCMVDEKGYGLARPIIPPPGVSLQAAQREAARPTAASQPTVATPPGAK